MPPAPFSHLRSSSQTCKHEPLLCKKEEEGSKQAVPRKWVMPPPPFTKNYKGTESPEDSPRHTEKEGAGEMPSLSSLGGGVGNPEINTKNGHHPSTSSHEPDSSEKDSESLPKPSKSLSARLSSGPREAAADQDPPNPFGKVTTPPARARCPNNTKPKVGMKSAQTEPSSTTVPTSAPTFDALTAGESSRRSTPSDAKSPCKMEGEKTLAQKIVVPTYRREAPFKPPINPIATVHNGLLKSEPIGRRFSQDEEEKKEALPTPSPPPVREGEICSELDLGPPNQARDLPPPPPLEVNSEPVMRPDIISSTYEVWPDSHPSPLPSPLQVTLRPFPVCTSIPVTPETDEVPCFVRCRNCCGFVNCYSFIEGSSYFCSFCSTFSCLPQKFFHNSNSSKSNNKEGARKVREDLATNHVKYGVDATYRTVPNLPTDIHVVCETMPDESAFRSPCLVVVCCSAEINLITNKSILSISDFSDILVTTSISSLTLLNPLERLPSVSILSKTQGSSATLLEGIKLSSWLSSQVGGGNIICHSNIDHLSLTSCHEISEYNKLTNTSLEVRAGAGGDKGRERRIGNGTSGLYDVTVR